MPTPTQINTDDIRELRDSNQRIESRFDKLIDEIHGLRVDMAHEFRNINVSMEELRGELKEGLGELRGELREFKGRMETWLSVAKWAVGAIVLGFTLIGGLAFNTSREVARLDARMTSSERTSQTLQSSMEKLTDALREKREDFRLTPKAIP